MGYQSKTYSLSDEVVDAIESAKSGGVSPNRFLRELMGLDSHKDGGGISAAVSVARHIADLETGRASIDAVAPVPAENAAPAPFNPKCLHCGDNFGAWNRGATVCPDCKRGGHGGNVKDCPRCGEYGTGAL